MNVRHRGALKCLAVAIAALVSVACASTVSRGDLAAEYYNLGNAYYELEQFAESARYLARAHELDPTLVRASYNLARAYVELGRYQEAIDLLDELLARDPENAVLIETMAYSYYRLGEVEQAAVEYERAMDLNPTDVELLENRAQIAVLQEEYALAAELLERVMALAPEDTEVLRTAAETYALAEREEDAVRMMRSYVAAEPEDAAGAQYLAELLVTESRYADALAVLERIVEGEAFSDVERATASFATAEILLTAAEEEQRGLQALAEAVALGFVDRAAVEALLERDDLVATGEVRSVLESAGLLGRASEATEEATGRGDDAEPDASTSPDEL